MLSPVGAHSQVQILIVEKAHLFPARVTALNLALGLEWKVYSSLGAAACSPATVAVRCPGPLRQKGQYLHRQLIFVNLLLKEEQKII